MSERIEQGRIDRLRVDVSLTALVGQHVKLRRSGREMKGLCPFHREKSPSFGVVEEHGFFHCFGCGAHGDAIALLMQLGHMEFPAAVESLLATDPYAESAAASFGRRFRESAAEYAAKGTARWDTDAEARAAAAKADAIFHNAAPAKGTLAEAYLRKRSISTVVLPPCARFATMPYWHTWKGSSRPSNLGDHPALLLAVEDASGVTAIQIIYLAADATKLCLPDRDNPGEFLPAKKSKGSLGFGAVRLSRTGGAILGLAEGGETGLAAKQIFSLPVWATLGHSRFAAALRAGGPSPGARVVTLPRDVDTIILFADRARDRSVDAKALQAAESLEWQGYTVDIQAPPPEFKDWNDVLKARQG